jgi:cholest-4-en-3-one 26-monooxygenase
MNVSDIDLLDRDRFTQGIPHEWFTWLRSNEPVFHHDEPDGPGFWVVTKHEDVVTCNRAWEKLSSAGERGGVIAIEEERAQRMAERMSDDSSAEGGLMLQMDPPRHTRYRKLVNRGFTPRMIQQLEPRIRELTSNILDEALQHDPCDFVTEIAAELPLEVIAELIGVPREDRQKIFEWSNTMVGNEDPEYQVGEERMLEAQIELFMYAQQLAEQHRESGGDDIISALLSADIDGESLSDMDFNLFFLLLSVAGNETTRNAISHGMNAFLEHPDQWALLAADPDGRIDTATEEILRWASPVLYFRRNATTDLELRGRQIKEGDKVTLWYISANRDEDVFVDPFTFDIERSPNNHIAFGGGGPHFCLGAQLARMEIRVLLDELVKRVDRVESLGRPDLLRSNFIGGIKHLPVRFHLREG